MSRQRAQQLASEFLACADPTGWFEVLYAEPGSNYVDLLHHRVNYL